MSRSEDDNLYEMCISKIELLENEYEKLFMQHEEIGREMYRIEKLKNTEEKLLKKLEKRKLKIK